MAANGAEAGEFDPGREIKRLEDLGGELKTAEPDRLQALIAEHLQTAEMMLGVLEALFQHQQQRGPMVMLVKLLMKLAGNSTTIIQRIYPGYLKSTQLSPADR